VIRKIFNRLVNFENPFYNVIIIFVLTSACLTVYSFRQNPVELFSQEIAQTRIAKYLTSSGDSTNLSNSATADSLVAAEDTTKKMDSTAQRFLLIGDSMLEGLGTRMNDYCEKNGHTMKRVIWYSSSTLWFGNCDTIAYYVKKENPTYVVLVIGSMELFIRNIKEDRKEFVQHILKQISGLPYIWVGPPNWTKDTGINDLLISNVPKKNLFISKDMVMDRCKDGVHPTMTAASKWMDSIAVFMMTESAHPVLLELPDTKASHYTSTDILSPNPPPTLK